jgi:hypothetical protein
MASSGIRLGAWDYLRWSHIRPIEKYGKVVAVKLLYMHGRKTNISLSYLQRP